MLRIGTLVVPLSAKSTVQHMSIWQMGLLILLYYKNNEGYPYILIL